MGLFQLHFVALCGLLLITSTTATLSPDSHGICYTYTIQGGDTCASIAEAHGITVADIETYNANTWAWYGCKGDWYQGSFICLSSGEPPMPAALPHATCGPQVPGATRLDSWSELTALNPCPSSECCTRMGACSTGADCIDTQICIDNCEAGATGKFPAPSPTQSSKTSSKTSTQTSTKTTAKTTLSTSTKTKTTAETITTTKATTTTLTVSRTSTRTESETPAWTLSIYDGYKCDGNYYTIQGHNTEGSACLSIQNGHLSYSSIDADVWCRYYTDGGFNSTECDGGPVFEVWSWILHGGTCLGYEHDCGSTEPNGQSQSIHEYPMCTRIAEPAVGMAIDWRSIRCTAT